MVRARHTYIRARLAGLYSRLPIGVGLLLIGWFVLGVCSSNITPSSVSVRGYYRRDGTYVSPYHRRPPGSVAHDEPYQFGALCGLGLAIAGLISTGSFIHALWKKSDFDLLPPIGYVSTLPPPPVKPRVPDAFAKSRKLWRCRRCPRLISVGDRYWYFSNPAPYAGRERICPSCVSAVATEAKRYPQEAIAYSHLVAEEQRRVARIHAEQYRVVYGYDAPAEELGVFIEGRFSRRGRHGRS